VEPAHVPTLRKTLGLGLPGAFVNEGEMVDAVCVVVAVGVVLAAAKSKTAPAYSLLAPQGPHCKHIDKSVLNFYRAASNRV